MWSETLPNGKVKYVERYIDPLTGKLRRVSVVMEKDTARARKAALEVLNAKIQAVSADGPEKKEKLTLGKLIELYLSDQKGRIKESTYQRNKYVIHKLAALLGEDTLVPSLSAGYIRKALSGQKASTYNERMTRFKAMMRWAYENDYVDDIRYIDKIKVLPDSEKKQRLKEKYLEAEELAALIDGMTVERWRLLTEFLALSGLRIGEATALTMDDVDLDALAIHITKTYDPNNEIVTSPKTSDSARDVYIQPELEDVCWRIRKYTRKSCIAYGCRSNLFFCDHNGEHISYYAYCRYLKTHSQKILGRKITPHVLRHTHTSLMAEAGVPLETISRRLGHSDSKVTREVYLHVTEGMKEKDRNLIRSVRIL